MAWPGCHVSPNLAAALPEKNAYQVPSVAYPAGMSPAAAIVAGTRNGAEILGLDEELGTITAGKSADFIVLDENPLEDITHSRAIAEVYLRGHRVDRERLRAMWAEASASDVP